MLPVLRLAWPAHVRVHANMLLELLECVVGALGHALKAIGMHVGVGDMAVREEGARRHGMVW